MSEYCRQLTENRIVTRLHNRFEQLLALATRRLGLKPRRHVRHMNQACLAALKREFVGADLDLERRAIGAAVNPAACVQLFCVAGQPIEPRQVGLSVHIPHRQGEKFIGRIAVLRDRSGIHGEESMRLEVEHPHRRGVAVE